MVHPMWAGDGKKKPLPVWNTDNDKTNQGQKGHYSPVALHIRCMYCTSARKNEDRRIRKWLRSSLPSTSSLEAN